MVETTAYSRDYMSVLKLGQRRVALMDAMMDGTLVERKVDYLAVAKGYYWGRK